MTPADPYADFAAFYDLYVGDRTVDIPFYLEYARAARPPVLEVGAGAGRLTLPIARAGVSVVAVDISEKMLALLRKRLQKEPGEVRKRVRVVHADMCELDVGEQFDPIIVSYYTFNYLLTTESQSAALNRLSQHMTAGARLIIEVFIPYARIEDCPTEPVPRIDTTDPATGNHVRGWNKYHMDLEQQIETRTHIFEVTPPDGETVRREFQTQRRYSFPQQLEELFAQQGLEVTAMFEDYNKAPAGMRSGELIYELRLC